MEEEGREEEVNAVIPHPNTLARYIGRRGMHLLPFRILLVCEGEQISLQPASVIRKELVWASFLEESNGSPIHSVQFVTCKGKKKCLLFQKILGLVCALCNSDYLGFAIGINIHGSFRRNKFDIQIQQYSTFLKQNLLYCHL